MAVTSAFWILILPSNSWSQSAAQQRENRTISLQVKALAADFTAQTLCFGPHYSWTEKIFTCTDSAQNCYHEVCLDKAASQVLPYDPECSSVIHTNIIPLLPCFNGPSAKGMLNRTDKEKWHLAKEQKLHPHHCTAPQGRESPSPPRLPADAVQVELSQG